MHGIVGFFGARRDDRWHHYNWKGCLSIDIPGMSLVTLLQSQEELLLCHKWIRGVVSVWFESVRVWYPFILTRVGQQSGLFFRLFSATCEETRGESLYWTCGSCILAFSVLFNLVLKTFLVFYIILNHVGLNYESFYEVNQSTVCFKCLGAKFGLWQILMMKRTTYWPAMLRRR